MQQVTVIQVVPSLRERISFPRNASHFLSSQSVLLRRQVQIMTTEKHKKIMAWIMLNEK